MIVVGTDHDGLVLQGTAPREDSHDVRHCGAADPSVGRRRRRGRDGKPLQKAVVGGLLETDLGEAPGDVLGGGIEPRRSDAPALSGVVGQEGNVGADPLGRRGGTLGRHRSRGDDLGCEEREEKSWSFHI